MNASTNTISATTIPGVPLSCSVRLPLVYTNFPGLIALGPTLYERDILHACCHTLQTSVFSVNGTACLQTSACRVDECTINDPVYACVALQRKVWGVNGTFGCLSLKDYTGSAAGGKKAAVKKIGGLWVVVAVAVAMSVVGFGGL